MYLLLAYKQQLPSRNSFMKHLQQYSLWNFTSHAVAVCYKVIIGFSSANSEVRTVAHVTQ